jgi:hypothetical protein
LTILSACLARFSGESESGGMYLNGVPSCGVGNFQVSSVGNSEGCGAVDEGEGIAGAGAWSVGRE